MTWGRARSSRKKRCRADSGGTGNDASTGLLEGAAAGVGLGHEFLRHCQRTRALVHVVDGTSPDPTGDYGAIRTELELFNPDLLSKPQVLLRTCWICMDL